MQREISEMLHYDSVLQNALAPERATGLDLQVSVVPSITHVYVSNDLQVRLGMTGREQQWAIILTPLPCVLALRWSRCTFQSTLTTLAGSAP